MTNMKTSTRPVAFQSASPPRVILRIVEVPEWIADALLPGKNPVWDENGRGGESFLMRVVPGTPGAIQANDGDPGWYVAAETDDSGRLRLLTEWPAWADEEERIQNTVADWRTVELFGAPAGCRLFFADFAAA